MKKDDLKVFISARDSICDECQEDLGRGAWVTLMQDKGALCLSCADLDHLIFLPLGDVALTRRSRKYSKLSAVVLKWSRARKRYERQGLLIEEEALKTAEEECLADSDARARQRKRERERHETLDRQYVERFAKRIRELYPQCPVKTEMKIAEHACLKYSGRVGRCAMAKNFDEDAVRLSVIAHIRHKYTSYDTLLAKGHDRWDARNDVENEVQQVLTNWKYRTTNQKEKTGMGMN
jgi:hypothetical protein